MIHTLNYRFLNKPLKVLTNTGSNSELIQEVNKLDLEQSIKSKIVYCIKMNQIKIIEIRHLNRFKIEQSIYQITHTK